MLPDAKEKWLRVITSIGALYLESCLHGEIMPLLANWKWASTTSDEEDRSVGAGQSIHGEGEARVSLTVAALFFATGALELGLSPIAGLTADRYGFDAVLMIGLLVSTLKCLVYGFFETSLVVVGVNRVLQGIMGACIQPIALARIKDVYDETSKEYMTMIGLAVIKISFTYFGGLVTAAMFDVVRRGAFLLFIPIPVLLVVGVLFTFRKDNFHSSPPSLMSDDDGKMRIEEDTKLCAPETHLRVIFDIQILFLTWCFFVLDLGRTALEPSIAVWLTSNFGVDQLSTGLIFGLCGLATVTGSIACARILPIVPAGNWMVCTACLGVTGLLLLVLDSSRDLTQTVAVLFFYYLTSSATRFIITAMCSTIADYRYSRVYGLVFSFSNIGLSASLLLGPVLSMYLFSPICGVCLLGAGCLITTPFLFCLRKIASSTGPNLMDHCHQNADEQNDQEYEILYTEANVPFTYDEHLIPVQPRVENEK